jgi:hypothetical protein
MSEKIGNVIDAGTRAQRTREFQRQQQGAADWQQWGAAQLRGHRIEAARLAISLRPLEAVA